MTTNTPIDYNSDEIHDEVMSLLLNEEDRGDLFTLFATDPKYYLDLFKNYTKTKEGYEIYLPYLFNLTTKRSKGRLYISFKLNDNDKWTEVGYDIDTCNDEDVYKAFAEQVSYLVKNPPSGRVKINNIPVPSSLASDNSKIVNLNNVSRAYKYLLDFYPDYIKKTNSDDMLDTTLDEPKENLIENLPTNLPTNLTENLQEKLTAKLTDILDSEIIKDNLNNPTNPTNPTKEFNDKFNKLYEEQKRLEEQKLNEKQNTKNNLNKDDYIKSVLIESIKTKLGKKPTYKTQFLYELSKLNKHNDLMEKLNRNLTQDEWELYELANKHGTEYEKFMVYNYIYNENKQQVLTKDELTLIKKFNIDLSNIN